MLIKRLKRILLLSICFALPATACGREPVSEPLLQTEQPQTAAPEPVSGEPDAAYKKITPEEAKKIMDEGGEYVLLDVRTEAEYAEKRIYGAMLIPHTVIIDEAAETLPDTEAVILVYCRSGVRSAYASQALVELGYTQVYDIGGIIDWPYDTING